MSHGVDVARGHRTRGAERETSEKTVAHVPPGRGARSLRFFGELQILKIPSRRTGGAYSLFEVATSPGAGPPPHVNHREEEFFYILEGEYEFLSGGESLRVGPGSLVYVPRGTLHAHKNVGEGVGRMLATQTPGGLYERFFEEVGEAVDADAGPTIFEDQPDEGRVAKIAAEHGIEIPPKAKKKARSGNTTKEGERDGG